MIPKEKLAALPVLLDGIRKRCEGIVCEDARTALAAADDLLAEVKRLYSELADANYDMARSAGELARVTRERDEALRERDLARPVVGKAQVWRDQFARPTTSPGPRHVALCEAVDTYESAMEALAALPGKPEAPADE